MEGLPRVNGRPNVTSASDNACVARIPCDHHLSSTSRKPPTAPTCLLVAGLLPSGSPRPSARPSCLLVMLERCSAPDLKPAHPRERMWYVPASSAPAGPVIFMQELKISSLRATYCHTFAPAVA